MHRTLYLSKAILWIVSSLILRYFCKALNHNGHNKQGLRIVEIEWWAFFVRLLVSFCTNPVMLSEWAAKILYGDISDGGGGGTNLLWHMSLLELISYLTFLLFSEMCLSFSFFKNYLLDFVNIFLFSFIFFAIFYLNTWSNILGMSSFLFYVFSMFSFFFCRVLRFSWKQTKPAYRLVNNSWCQLINSFTFSTFVNLIK